MTRGVDSAPPTFEEVMKLTRGRGDHRLLEDDEALALYDCCLQVPEGGRVVEVGCDAGRSSSIIAQVGVHARYLSVHIDPFSEHPDNRDIWCDMMSEIAGRYALVLTETRFAARHLMGTKIDLAYIDGDHSEDAVSTDLSVVASRVRIGGLLAAHDLDMPSVVAAIHPYVAQGWQEVGVFNRLGVWRRK